MRKLAVLAALGISTPALGAGGYVGGAIGQVRLEDTAGSLSLDADDTGFKVFGGYEFNQYFSAEIAYIDGGTPEDNVLGVTVEADPSAIQASAIGTLPLTDIFGLHLRASLLSWENTFTASNGFNSASVDTDGEDFAWGVGGTFKIGQRGAIRLEFEGADLDGTDVSILTIGGVIRFGSTD